MIKENQRVLNIINILTDGFIILLSMPIAYFIRFTLMSGGVESYPLRTYLILTCALLPVYLASYAALGLYRSFRHTRLYRELTLLYLANLAVIGVLLMGLFLFRLINISRLTIFYFFLAQTLGLTAKRVLLRGLLRYYRSRGYNQKYVLLVGSSSAAQKYINTISASRELGYTIIGYIAPHDSLKGTPYLGDFSRLHRYLDRRSVDEVVAALDIEDYGHMPKIIEGCEKAGTKLSIIPIFADYIPAHPKFDDLNGIPLMNIRRIPLDNMANAFLKRGFDIVGSLLLIILTSPIMLATAIGVKLSSPGPILFRQERVGRGKKPFIMYKFRSMRVNEEETSGWSTRSDPRKTRFGSFIRKFSIDEFPQFFNVLKGDMSLVGPRPEVPFYVNQFKEEIPLYMVKHQVRPGITGWAQVNGYRGDTSIKGRIEHDIYYIENWNFLFDLQILFLTVVKGFVNDESVQI